MSETIETVEYRGYTLKLKQDDDGESPREWDNLGTLIWWHRRYTSPDKNEFSSPEDFYAELSGLNPDDLEWADRRADGSWDKDVWDGDYFKWKGRWRHKDNLKELQWKEIDRSYVVLPVYMYDHSGITINTGGFSCPWDSGQVGYIYCSKERFLKETGYTKKQLFKEGKAVKMLEDEVKTFDDYLTGNVVGYVVYKDGEECDGIGSAVWGFYPDHDNYHDGYYGFGYAIEEAKSWIDADISEKEEAHFQRLKTWIKNRVPLYARQPLTI